MIDSALLSYVKRKLNITWNDEDTNARVEEIVESAIPKMINILGISDPDFDFSEPGEEKTLFGAYCLYEWNHVAHEFQANYANDIAQVRERHEVKYHAGWG